MLNNNYLNRLLTAIRGVSRPYAEGHRRLDQVRYSLAELKEETGVGTEDVRDRMVDFGVQSYWMSHHPWIVPEPFTPEPCETYSKADLDEWAAVIKKVSDECVCEPGGRQRSAARLEHRQDGAPGGPGGAQAVGFHVARLPEEDQGGEMKKLVVMLLLGGLAYVAWRRCAGCCSSDESGSVLMRRQRRRRALTLAAGCQAH